MINRINLLLKAKNITAKQFAEEIGIQPSGMSHILGGRNNPSLDFVSKVLRRYPEIDANWLLLGKGEMYGTVRTGGPLSSERPSRPTPTDESPTLFPPTEQEQPRREEPPTPYEPEPYTPVPPSRSSEPDPRYEPSYFIVPPDEPHPPVPAPPSDEEEPEVEQIILVYNDHTFRVLRPQDGQ